MRMRQKHRLKVPSECRPGNRHIPTRREFLIGAGVSATTLYLAGCGGGGSETVNGAGVSRTTLSGALTDQVNQFSLASEQIGNIWEGSSPALTSLQTFANGGNRSSRVVGAGSRVMIQAVWYSLLGVRSSYERLANGLLAEDDQGYVADAIDASNGFSGNTGTSNPQWLAAVMLQTYSAFRVTGALMKIIQVAGVKQMAEWAAAQSTDTNKMIAYGMLADCFNNWIDAIQKGINGASLAEFKLDVSAAVTPANVAAQIAKIPVLLSTIPFGPGYRVGGTASGIPVDDMLTGTGASNFSMSFFGSIVKIMISAGTLPENYPAVVDLSTATYDLAARLGTTGLGPQITTLAGSLTAAQTAANTLLSKLLDSVLPALDGSAATSLVNIASGAYGVVAAVAQAILSDHSLIGDALSGEIALGYLSTEIGYINNSGNDTMKAILKSVDCDISYLQSTYLIGGNTVALRSIPVENIPSRIETDQIGASSSTLICQNTLCYPPPNAGWDGNPSNKSISVYRETLSGLFPTGQAPRTFNNAEICGAGLFYNLLFRNSGTLRPDFVTDNRLIFCTSNFARVLRRSPGAVIAKLPSITAAALLCTAPNFAPSRNNGPVDLSKISSLGVLSPLTTLVPGVAVHVI